MTTMASSLAIARVAILRLVRDRSNLFFVGVFPLLLVMLIGLQFGGEQDLRLVVAAQDVGQLGQELIDDLVATGELEVERVDDELAVIDRVAYGEADGGLVLPRGYDDAVRAGGGVVLEFVGRPDSVSPAVQSLVLPVVASQATLVSLADLDVLASGAGFGQALDRARLVQAALSGTRVEVTQVGSDETEEAFRGLGRFDLGATQQLSLFVFLSALTNAAALLQSREYGVTRRLLAHPVTPGGVVRGELLGRFGVAMVQGLVIVLGTTVLFGVTWGDPLGATAVLLLFALVSAGAGLLLGAVASTQQQAAATGVGLGIGLAALGGSMLPLELMPDSVRTVANVTPHAWAYEAWAELVRRDGTIVDIGAALGVLAAMAAVLVGLASWALRRTLTRV